MEGKKEIKITEKKRIELEKAVTPYWVMNLRMDLEDRIRSVFETQGIELNYEQIMKARRFEFPKPRDLDKKLKKMIALFRWMTEPGKYTLSLEAGLLNNDCFVRNYMLGNGYDWEKVASAFMKKQEIDSD